MKFICTFLVLSILRFLCFVWTILALLVLGLMLMGSCRTGELPTDPSGYIFIVGGFLIGGLGWMYLEDKINRLAKDQNEIREIF